MSNSLTSYSLRNTSVAEHGLYKHLRITTRATAASCDIVPCALSCIEACARCAESARLRRWLELSRLHTHIHIPRALYLKRAEEPAASLAHPTWPRSGAILWPSPARARVALA